MTLSKIWYFVPSLAVWKVVVAAVAVFTALGVNLNTIPYGFPLLTSFMTTLAFNLTFVVSPTILNTVNFKSSGLSGFCTIFWLMLFDGIVEYYSNLLLLKYTKFVKSPFIALSRVVDDDNDSNYIVGWQNVDKGGVYISAWNITSVTLSALFTFNVYAFGLSIDTSILNDVYLSDWAN